MALRCCAARDRRDFLNNSIQMAKLFNYAYLHQSKQMSVKTNVHTEQMILNQLH